MSHIVLLHGWPHTSRLWERVVPLLDPEFTVHTPDLRGGDAATGAAAVEALLDSALPDPAAGAPDATVVAIDAAVPAALWLALTRPERVRGLVVSEALVPGRPFDGAAPWWFGFHATPGLPETVLLGHETEYVDWFLTEHSVQPIDPDVRRAFAAAYTGREALASGFAWYRAMASDAEAFAEGWKRQRLTVPTLAVAGGVVGDLPARQLSDVTDDLTTAAIPDCGHLVPLEQPEAFAQLIATHHLRDHAIQMHDHGGVGLGVPVRTGRSGSVAAD